MPVRKFRRSEDMERPVWRYTRRPGAFRAMRALWDVASRTSKRRYPPGVYKHRSIEEMQELQARWANEQ